MCRPRACLHRVRREACSALLFAQRMASMFQTPEPPRWKAVNHCTRSCTLPASSTDQPYQTTVVSGQNVPDAHHGSLVLQIAPPTFSTRFVPTLLRSPQPRCFHAWPFVINITRSRIERGQQKTLSSLDVFEQLAKPP